MEKVFDEVCDVFDSKTIHIGTDELRLGGIRDKKEREEMGELFRGYINHFNAYLAKKGRTTRIWSGYEHMPGKTKPDPSVVIDMWVTNDAAAKVKEGYHFINSNHGVTYIVPNTNIYGISNSRVYEKWSPNIFSNKKGGVIPKDCPNLLGGKFHIWNDNGYQYAGYSNNEIARLAMPSLLVFAEKLWGRKGAESFKKFQQRASMVLPGNDGFEMTSHSKGKHDPQNPMLGQFPGTTFLQRKVHADQKGVVWKLKKPTPFVENTSSPLQLKGSPDHLSYPWTASFDITRYSDSKIGWMMAPHGHEILMNSRLATLYLDSLLSS
jgi:hexosaminidase